MINITKGILLLALIVSFGVFSEEPTSCDANILKINTGISPSNLEIALNTRLMPETKKEICKMLRDGTGSFKKILSSLQSKGLLLEDIYGELKCEVNAGNYFLVGALVSNVVSLRVHIKEFIDYYNSEDMNRKRILGQKIIANEGRKRLLGRIHKLKRNLPHFDIRCDDPIITDPICTDLDDLEVIVESIPESV